MNEAAIVSMLQAKMVKPEGNAPEVAPIVSEVVQDAERLSKDIKQPNDVAALKLLDFFQIDGMERKDRETLDKLNKIYDWAQQQAGTDDSVDVMTVIRELEGRLGLTFRKADKLEAIYRHMKLDAERRRIEKEMNLV